VKSYSEQLVELGLKRETDSISNAAYASAELLLLDTLGCAIAGYPQPGIAGVVTQMRDWGGKPEADIMITGDRVPAPNAAFANGVMIHALDYDDVYIPGSLHITSVVVPAVLAATQMSDASGKDALAAMIMGIEIAGRIAIAGRSRRRGIGFLPSSTAGGFGAVIAAARLLGLSEKQTVNAMGINYAQASGNRQALFDMTLTKRLQPAFAARSAMWAVSLAVQGLTGPGNVFEGKAGYFTTYLNGEIPSIDEFLFDCPVMQIERVSIKRFPSCGACHNVQIAVERLVAEEEPGPGDIDRVEIFGCSKGGLVGGPFEPGENPQVDAQFNVAWCVAHTLLRGPATLADYTDQSVGADREVAELANRIGYTGPPDDLPAEVPPPEGFPEHLAKYQGVIVHMTDGRRLMRAQSPGQTHDPGQITRDSVVRKFRECVDFSGLCSGDRSHPIMRAVNRLQASLSCDELIESLAVKQGDKP